MSRQPITNHMSDALSGNGLRMVHEGQTVHMRAVREGAGVKAAWRIIAEVKGELAPVSTEPHESDESDERKGVFS
jgi:hypothetical protein